MAAIRETFEETGLLIGSAEFGEPESPPPGAWSEYAAVGVYPTLEDIHFIGRAITPPRNKLRFDTFFLAADATAIGASVEGKISPDSELVELVWATIPEALELGLAPPPVASASHRPRRDRTPEPMGPGGGGYDPSKRRGPPKRRRGP